MLTSGQYEERPRPLMYLDEPMLMLKRGPTFQMAPFELLYHTNPGRGRVAPMDATLMMDPPLPWATS